MQVWGGRRQSTFTLPSTLTSASALGCAIPGVKAFVHTPLIVVGPFRVSAEQVSLSGNVFISPSVLKGSLFTWRILHCRFVCLHLEDLSRCLLSPWLLLPKKSALNPPADPSHVGSSSLCASQGLLERHLGVDRLAVSSLGAKALLGCTWACFSSTWGHLATVAPNSVSAPLAPSSPGISVTTGGMWDQA